MRVDLSSTRRRAATWRRPQEAVVQRAIEAQWGHFDRLGLDLGALLARVDAVDHERERTRLQLEHGPGRGAPLRRGQPLPGREGGFGSGHDLVARRLGLQQRVIDERSDFGIDARQARAARHAVGARG